jgi:hypothetical protein
LLARKLDALFEAGAAELSKEYFTSANATEQGWDITWASGVTQPFDYIVVAAGYLFPRYPLAGDDGISIADTGSVAGRAMSIIGPDLRMRFGAEKEPERIWVAGPGANVIRPVAHLINIAARDARSVAQQVLGDDVATEMVS